MKLLYLTYLYPSYVNNFYARHPGLERKSYSDQKSALDYDAFAGADFWTHALSTVGFETLGLAANVGPLQHAWWREHFPARRLPDEETEIVVEQVKKFAPDVLWFDDWSELLLRRLRAEVPSIRLVFGWTGSAIPADLSAARHEDLVLSCAQESVDRLRQMGLKAEQLHHGFEPRLLARLQPSTFEFPLSFIGQLIQGSQFHNERARLLERLGAQGELVVFSEIASLGLEETAKTALKTALYHVYRAGDSLGAASLFDRIPVLNRQKGKSTKPVSQRNRRLKPFLRGARYGLEMYQTIRDSRVSLNIHADSSPQHASNMRLFEATGVGTCLLTDWRPNLSGLFKLDEEVISYKSTEECLEKARWLFAHPVEAARIGEAGQRRVLKEHTFGHRAVRLAELIKERI